ncbi:MAG: tRNA pseudouridine(55) synthase TruB [Candidatus Hydrogenedentota bacterium]
MLLIDKESGRTSNEVVMYFKKRFKQSKVGHGGTLDPHATGLLIILLGNATRFFEYIIELEKEYLFTVQFGAATTTFDACGEKIKQSTKKIKAFDVFNLLKEFTGEIEQIPPMYSAKKMEGKPLYKLARKGIEVKRRPKKVRVYTLEMISFDEDKQRAVLRGVVGRGTYIRALANDMGEKLGVYGFCDEIRRTRIGDHKVENATKFLLLQEDKTKAEIINSGNILPNIERREISKEERQMLKNGNIIKINVTPNVNKLVRLFENNDFIGLGKIEFGFLKSIRLIGDHT